MPNMEKYQYHYGRLTCDPQAETKVFAIGQKKENFGVHGQIKTSFNPQVSFSSREFDNDPLPFSTREERDNMVAHIRKRFAAK